MPLVGPSENECTDTPCLKRTRDLETKRFPLSYFTIATAVETDLCHQQWLVSGHILQAGQVGIQTLPRLQIDVEGNKIEKWKLEILCSWKIYVRNKRITILILHSPPRLTEEIFNSTTAIPANDCSRNLVTDSVAEDRWMTGASANGVACVLNNSFASFPAVEKRNVLFPRQPNHYAKSVRRRNFKQPRRRWSVDPNCIQSHLGHRQKVLRHYISGRKLNAQSIRTE